MDFMAGDRESRPDRIKAGILLVCGLIVLGYAPLLMVGLSASGGGDSAWVFLLFDSFLIVPLLVAAAFMFVRSARRVQYTLTEASVDAMSAKGKRTLVSLSDLRRVQLTADITMRGRDVGLLKMSTSMGDVSSLGPVAEPVRWATSIQEAAQRVGATVNLDIPAEMIATE